MQRELNVPAPKINMPAGRLIIESDDGETASITLTSGDGTLIARAYGFRRPQIGPHTWFDAPEIEIVGTFAAFLGNALEDEDAAKDWIIQTIEDVDAWADHMSLMADEDYPRCETCDEPIDYCQGHGTIG